MNDMSMTITPSRAARARPPSSGHQFGRPQESFSTLGSCPAGAYQSGLSQPLSLVK